MSAAALAHERPQAGIGRPQKRAAGRQEREEAMTQPDVESGNSSASPKSREVEPGVIWSRQEADEGHGVDTIAEAVANALHWDLALPRHRVVARCEGGWVTLTGEVERGYQRSAAEADVLRVVGVRGVTNAITVGAVAPQIAAPTRGADH
jgi:osmotically-inducible protein OsmY